MEPSITGHEAISRHDMLVHNWRVSQLPRLGVPVPLAEIYAERIDWHQIARLVQGGCPPRLALRIICLSHAQSELAVVRVMRIEER